MQVRLKSELRKESNLLLFNGITFALFCANLLFFIQNYSPSTACKYGQKTLWNVKCFICITAVCFTLGELR